MSVRLYQGGRLHGLCRIDYCDPEWGPISNGAPMDTGESTPDLRDPCTLGGLLSLVREAYSNPHITTCVGLLGRERVEWDVETPDPRDQPGGYREITTRPSEAEALVAALEAAPGAGVTP